MTHSIKPVDDKTEKFLGVLTEIVNEMDRAHMLHGRTSMLGPELSEGNRLAILVEEVGEVAKEMCEGEIAQRETDWAAQRKELIQVAAMATAWVVAGDRKEYPV
jgi:hypothetical protein